MRGHVHGGDRPFLPGTGHIALTPFYDLIGRIGGIRVLHRAVADAAELRPGLRVLEVGCGTGSLAISVARRHPGTEVAGLDPDQRALVRARRKAARAGVAVRLDRGFAEELPHPDGAFDRVLSSLMLHHVDAAAKPRVLAEVRRVLAPGGLLVLADFGGAAGPGHGFLARRAGRAHLLHGQLGDAVPKALADSGFEQVTELEPVRIRFGPVALYRAVAP